MLPVGCRLPEFEIGGPEAPDDEVAANFGPGDPALALVQERCRITKRLAGDLLWQLHMETSVA